MGRFDKYKGKIDLKLEDGEEITLKVSVEDYGDLIVLYENKEKNDFGKGLNSILTRIVKRSYPEITQEEADGLVLCNFMAILEGVMNKIYPENKKKLLQQNQA